MILCANIPKQPRERKRYGVGWKERLSETGAVIASIVSISVFLKSTGADITGTAKVAGSEQIDAGGKSISAMFAGGAPGDIYQIEFLAMTSDGETLEVDLELPIIVYGKQ